MTLTPLKPDYALSLSLDGLRLVQRAEDGWLSLGDVALDTSDLRASLAEIRLRAEVLAGHPIMAKLMIPNEQIRYLTLDIPAAAIDPGGKTIAAALDGLTPYPVEDLVFDWCVSQGKTQVAAVARQTLEEAENFARDHSFEPVSFAATPPAGSFDGEVFFGPTVATRPVERDSFAMRVTGVVGAAPAMIDPVDPSPAVPAVENDAAPEVKPDPVASEPVAPEADTTDDAAQARDGSNDDIEVNESKVEAPSAEVPEAEGPAPELPHFRRAKDGDNAPADKAEAAQPQDALADADGAVADTSEEPSSPASETPAAEPKAAPAPESDKNDDAPKGAPLFGSIRASRNAPAPNSANADTANDAKPVLAATKSEPPKGPGPRLTFGAARATRATVDTPPKETGKVDPPIAKPAASAATQKLAAAAKTGGFASIRASRTEDVPAKPAPAKPLETKAPAPVGVSAPVIPIDPAPISSDGEPAPALTATTLAGAPTPADTAEPVARAAAAAGDKGFFSRKLRAAASVVPGVGGGGSGSAAAAALRPRVPAPAQAVPATNDEAERMTVFGARGGARVGGKPRYLGLMLTVLLLMFLVGVAAMAAVFVDDRIARWFAPQTDAPTAAELAEEDIPLVAPTAPQPEQPVTLAALESPTATDAVPGQGGVIDALSRPEPLPQLTYDEATTSYAVTGIWQLAPDVPRQPSPVPLDDVFFAALDPKVKETDAIALPEPASFQPDGGLDPVMSPPPAGTVFDLDNRGLVRATPEGAVTPDGVTVYRGQPALVPPLRDGEAGAEGTVVTDPDAAEGSAEAAETDTDTPPSAEAQRLAAFRPAARPDDLVEQAERAVLNGRTRAELAALRPRFRPTSIQEQAAAAAKAEADAKAAAEAAEAQRKVDEAAAEVETAAAAAAAAEEAAKKAEEPPKIQGTRLAVAASRAPKTRPRNFARIVARATPREPEQDRATRAVAQVKPKTVKPPAPSRSSVTRNATVKNAIKLNKINLVGVYGKPSSRRALVRLKNGRYKKVKVGDRLDGGRIRAIGEGSLQYTKNGRSVTLKMPRT